MHLICRACRRHSGRNYRNRLALAVTANDLLPQLWIVDFESMLLRKPRTQLLELVGAGDGHRSPLLRAQLKRGQYCGLVLCLPDINALATIRKADLVWVGA